MLMMTAEHLPADEPFFAQWAGRGSIQRSLESARALMEVLGFSAPPSLAVVGSKGKGTAAAGATKALANAGLTTVTVTSPAFRSNRERLRLNGTALSHDEYGRLSAHLERLLPRLPQGSYLSPSGAYTVMGAWWAAEIGADVLVVEEGMGGATDEVSLFDHTALVVTPIFLEHAGIIGDDLISITENLLGAGSGSVRIAASAAQAPTVESLIRRAAQTWGAELLHPAPVDHRNPLIGANIGLGAAAGAALAELLGRTPRAIGPIDLPGRSSLHEGPGGRWFVDAAISPSGVAAALAASPLKSSTIIASWPLSKDRDGCRALVPDAIEVAVPGLDYPPGLPQLSDVVDHAENDVVALGTISFVAEVLNHLKVPTDLW